MAHREDASWIDRGLRVFADVRSGEGFIALLLALNVFLILMAYYILKTVRESAPGSKWAVATEVHLVHRLAEEVAPGKTVVSLDQFGCLCSTMFRVSPNHLLWIMEELVAGRVHNVVKVPERIKHWSKVALDRMLTIM